jgi:hypothetical protein
VKKIEKENDEFYETWYGTKKEEFTTIPPGLKTINESIEFSTESNS